MENLTSVTLGLVRLYGPLALCLFTFLETSMLFPFLPSEVVVPAAAALLVTDLPSFAVFVAAAGLGGTVGAFVPFAVFSRTRLGERHWLGDHLAVSESRIERGQAWFRRWGRSSVLWGRFVPVLRSVVSIPAGLAGMSTLLFCLLTAVGTVGFYAAVGGLVYYGRRQSFVAAALAVAAERPLAVTLALLALFGVGVWLRLRRQRR